MENFAIIHTICRLALDSASDSVKHQVTRLHEALERSGDKKDADALRMLLTSADRHQAMTPRRLVPSRTTVSLPGEQLLPSTQLPADRETGVRLVEITFPDSERPQPHMPPALERAVSMLKSEWEHLNDLAQVGSSPAMSCLLTGAPGTGKTSLALWLGVQLGLPVLTVRVDAMMSSFLGTTSRNIAQVFNFANRFRCILLLDELDSIAKLRDDPNEVGEIKRVVNALLQNLDTRVLSGITIGITNHPKLLDPAVWRRFAAQIEVPLPNADAREAIISRYEQPIEIKPAVKRFMVLMTEGASGAEIETIVNLYKKRSVLSPLPTSPIECLRDIAHLNSGRLSLDMRQLLLKDDPEVARWVRSRHSRFTLADLGTLFDKSKSAVARWIEEPVVN